MTPKNIALLLVALGLMAAAVLSLSKNIFSPYVSFAEAKKKPGHYVQVIGQLDKSAPMSSSLEKFSFTLIEKNGTKLQAVHKGIKPLNFEHAEQVVLIGSFDKINDLFIADKVLVKCPSKYEKKSASAR